MTEPTPDQAGLRDQIARDIAAADGRYVHLEPLADASYEQMADVALARVAPLLAAKDTENARLRADLLGRLNALAVLLWLPARKTDTGFYALCQLIDDRHTTTLRERDEARAEVDKLRADQGAVMAALKGLLPAPKATDAELFKIGDVVFAVARLVDRLRADLAEALEVAERTARDTGQRHPLADVQSGLTGLAAREATKPCGCLACDNRPIDPALGFRMPIMHLCPQCGNKRCPGAADHRNKCSGSNKPGQPGSLYEDPPKPRRHELINPAGLYTEPRDPGGA